MGNDKGWEGGMMNCVFLSLWFSLGGWMEDEMENNRKKTRV